MEQQTKEFRLALELAETLNDKEALVVYQAFTRKYAEAFLRKVLAKVMSIPDHKIRKTRGALFTFLVKQQYGNSSKDDAGN